MNYDEIISLVYQAGKIVFNEADVADVKMKGDCDFVTAVDTKISDFLKRELLARNAGVGFMTEEEREHEFSEKCFILDPIDGTTNLVFDYKMSSVSLAYVESGKVTFGVVFNPFTDELFYAIKGKGAHFFDARGGVEKLTSAGAENYDGGTLRASERPLRSSLVEFGAGATHKDEADESFELGKRVFKRCLDVRRTCSTALALCYIAAGRLDGYFEKVIKPWDYAAGSLVLEEAGGKCSKWDGDGLPLSEPSTIVCANSVAFDELIAVVNG